MCEAADSENKLVAHNVNSSNEENDCFAQLDVEPDNERKFKKGNTDRL